MATADELRAVVGECLDGHICVQAWVGYAGVIFVGFGTDVIPASEQEESHPMPPYELQTNWADWQVESSAKVLGTADDEDEVMVKAVQALVGYSVLSWNYHEELQVITIEFDDNLSLKVKPFYNDERPNAESWWFVILETNRVVGVASNLAVFEGVYSHGDD